MTKTKTWFDSKRWKIHMYLLMDNVWQRLSDIACQLINWTDSRLQHVR